MAHVQHALTLAEELQSNLSYLISGLHPLNITDLRGLTVNVLFFPSTCPLVFLMRRPDKPHTSLSEISPRPSRDIA